MIKKLQFMEDINRWNLRDKPCAYSDGLIDKLLLLNKTAKIKVDILEVKKAIYYAKKYHGKQTRHSGEPYYSHPIEVAYMVSNYLFRTDILVSSILHDTIEDTDLTFDMIKEIFGEVVANQVMDLTRVKSTGKISSAEMIDSLFKQGKYDLLLIKEIDRWHNIQTIDTKSPEKILKIINETMASFIPLAAYFGTQKILKDLLKHCCQQTKIFMKKPTTESTEAVSKVLASLDI